MLRTLPIPVLWIRRFTVLLGIACVLLGSTMASEVSVLCSPSVKHPPHAARVRAILRDVGAEFHLDEGALPDFMVIFLTRRDAAPLHVAATTAIVVNHVDEEFGVPDSTQEATAPTRLYRIWIIDNPSEAAVAVAMVMAFSRQTKANLTWDQIVAIARRVCAKANAKISVQALRDPQ